MSRFDDNFQLILKHTVRIGRRSGFTETAMGQRRSTGETVVHSALSCYFDFNPGKFSNAAAGDKRDYQYIMFASFDANVQPGDWVYPNSFITGLTLGRIIGITSIPNFDGNTHHIEALIQKVS